MKAVAGIIVAALAVILSVSSAFAGEIEEQLVAAVRGGDLAAVEALTGKGADLNYTDDEGRTVISRAIQRGATDIIRSLIDNGADIADALPSAAMHAQEPAVLMLLSDYQADPDARGKDGATALIFASANGADEIVELLLYYGADIDAVDDNGKTPLIAAAWNGRTDCVKMLLDAGADTAATMENGFSALMSSAAQRKPELMLMLLEAGADINQPGPQGKTALIFSATNGCVDCVRHLLDYGADMDAVDDSGKTALAAALANPRHTDEQYAEIIRMLRDVGASE